MPGHGYWYPMTGAPDWCEKNYAWTEYIVEFWNTLSSLPLIAAGLIGLYYCVKFNYEWRFVLCNLVLTFVGVGSTAFHGTLKYEGQCLDELAMIYCALGASWGGSGVIARTAISVKCVRCTSYHGHAHCHPPATTDPAAPPTLPPPPPRAAAFLHTVTGATWVTGIGASAYAAAFTYVYFHLKESAYFHVFLVMYIVSIVVLVYKSYQFAVGSGNPVLKRLVKISAGVYVGGFLFLWLPEHFLCVLPTTDANRPVAVEAVQLHAWFHLTSTVGPYCWILFALLARYEKVGGEIRTTAMGRLPYVYVPSDKQKK